MERGSRLIDVPTEKDWDEGYRRLQAMYDTRSDAEEKRYPRVRAGLVLAALLLVGIAAVGLITFPKVF